MAETDFIIRGKTISRDNVAIDITDFYKMIKNFLLKEKSYDKDELNEKAYQETVSDGFKTTKIKFEIKKEIDDYTKFKIETTITISKYKLVNSGGKHLAKGNVKVEFDASLENDYKEKWETGIFNRFVRGVYDRFILGTHFNELGEDIKEECFDLVDEVKNYLDMVKTR